MSQRWVTVEPGIRRYTRSGGKRRHEATYHDPRTGDRRVKTFDRLVDARTWRAKQADTAVAARSPRLDEYGRDVIDRMENGEIRRPSGSPYRDATILGYRSSLEKHVYPRVGAIRVNGLAHRDAQDVVNAMSGMSGSTIRNALNALSVVLRQARREGYTQNDPLKDVSAPGRSRRHEAAIDHALIGEYLDALDADIRLAWALMFLAGLRIGEALGLERTHLRGGYIEVQQQLTALRRIGPVKTMAGVRRVPIIEPLARELDAYALPGNTLARDYTRTYFRRRSRACFERAGLEPITPHQARHTYASMMIEARVDYKMLSEVLGHDSIATTLDVYGHLMPRTYDAMRSAVESLLSADSTRTATR